jgi:hypothetical protein
MKVRQTLSSLVVCALLLNAGAAYAQTGLDTGGGKVINFDKGKFAATFKDRVVSKFGPLAGYSAVVIKGGKLVTETADGWAIRGNGDDIQGVKMTTSTPSDIGSSMKLISFIALLSHLEKKAAQKGDSVNTPGYLHASIRHYLPARWRAFVSIPPGNLPSEQQFAIRRVGYVTFAQLMQHKSGFRDVSANIPFDYIRRGIKQENVGVREYNNFNATLLTYLWPRLVDPAAADAIEKQIDAANVANDDDKTYGKLYGDFFEKWMQANVFNRITPRIYPSCDPAVDYPKRSPAVVFARYYENTLGADNPLVWSEKAANGGCHAQGGYYLSMRELAALMANFQATGVLVSAKARALMYDDSNTVTQDARLGWHKIKAYPFATKHFGVNFVPWHGGDGVGHSAVVQLPGGYIAVGAVVGPGASGDITNSLHDAWVEAIRDSLE